MHDLGREGSAQTMARAAIVGLEPTRTQRLAIDTTLLATSLARSGDVEQACAAGMTAAGYSVRTQLHRTLLRIASLRTALQPHSADSHVVEFEQYVRAMLPQAGSRTACGIPEASTSSRRWKSASASRAAATLSGAQ
jgi:hypothetical protein